MTLHLKTPPVVAILGANTNVGKTLISIGLCQVTHAQGYRAIYVKPLQTGFPQDSDGRLISHYAPQTEATTLFSWKDPLSPHLCVEREGWGVSDEQVLTCLESLLTPYVGAQDHVVYVEGAGGVLSPTAQGTPQADLFRALFPTVVLVGDSQLGGISTTLTAWESLRSRGFLVPLIVVPEGTYENHKAIAQAVAPHSQVVTVPQLPQGPSRDLHPWLASSSAAFGAMWSSLKAFSSSQGDPNRWVEVAKNHVWYPFFQHKGAGDPQPVQHSFGTCYGLLSQNTQHLVHNGSGSWWTQGLPYGDMASTQSWAHATARFGHVLFPGHIHEPAAQLAVDLLNSVGSGWARRVFFSDNGSTGMEVALKMAFGLWRSRRAGKTIAKPKVLGLGDSYHGDTLGAMNACSPSPFNRQELWYTPSGHWFTPPVWSFQKGRWVCRNPVPGATVTHVQSFHEITCPKANGANAHAYATFIENSVEAWGGWDHFGALLLEPLMHGAGGMLLIDPLFQRVLAQMARAHGVPVVVDEVFTGFWRLETVTGFQGLHILPDIAVFSKRLTGGLAPLACTLATEETFQAFLGDDTLSALLHGHSYTAQPGACALASHALERYQKAPQMTSGTLATLWPEATITRISHSPAVEGVVAVGQVLALHMKMKAKGYGVQLPPDLVPSFLKHGLDIRSLGSTLYLLTTPFCDEKKHAYIAKRVAEVLETTYATEKNSSF